MADFDNRLARGATTVADTYDAGLRAHMLRVYNYMVGALALTGAVAYLTAHSPLLNLMYQMVQTSGGVALQPTIIGWVEMLAPLALDFFLCFCFLLLCLVVVLVFFWVFVVLVGVLLVLFLF